MYCRNRLMLVPISSWKLNFLWSKFVLVLCLMILFSQSLDFLSQNSYCLLTLGHWVLYILSVSLLLTVACPSCFIPLSFIWTSPPLSHNLPNPEWRKTLLIWNLAFPLVWCNYDTPTFSLYNWSFPSRHGLRITFRFIWLYV